MKDENVTRKAAIKANFEKMLRCLTAEGSDALAGGKANAAVPWYGLKMTETMKKPKKCKHVGCSQLVGQTTQGQ